MNVIHFLHFQSSTVVWLGREARILVCCDHRQEPTRSYWFGNIVNTSCDFVDCWCLFLFEGENGNTYDSGLTIKECKVHAILLILFLNRKLSKAYSYRKNAQNISVAKVSISTNLMVMSNLLFVATRLRSTGCYDFVLNFLCDILTLISTTSKYLFSDYLTWTQGVTCYIYERGKYPCLK